MDSRRVFVGIGPRPDRRGSRGLDTGVDETTAERFVAALSGPFELVIAQPTPLCNVNCSYCYLPDRRRGEVMSVEVAEAVAQGIVEQDAAEPVVVLWHGGEPLATPRHLFERLVAPFEPLRECGRVVHQVQTNGTLIDAGWCELLSRYGFQVGVSIDGPRSLNVHRRDWQDRDIFDRVMRGITRLRQAGIAFTALAVVSPETITAGRELVGFMDAIGIGQVAINIEERENHNSARALVSRDDAQRFWRDLIAYRRGDTTLTVRELADVADYVKRRKAGEGRLVLPQPRPTVSWTGDVVVAAPELAGASAPQHSDFVVGNVLRTPLREIIAGVEDVGYVREYAEGLANCQASCSFWAFCQGRESAGNRFFEHGDFAATETAFCRNKRQAPVTALLAALETDATRGTPAAPAIVEVLRELASRPGSESGDR